MPKASELFTKNEILKVQYITKLFNGKVVRIVEKGTYEEERKSQANRKVRKTYQGR